MIVQVDIHQSPGSIGNAVANQIIVELAVAQQSGKYYLLGCPSGRTPRPIFAALATIVRGSEIDLSNLVLIMMDDYVEAAGDSYKFVSDDRHFSCHRFADREIVSVLNESLSEEKQIKADNVWFPDPTQAAAYDEKIAQFGGVDLFILASGASDGHVAFNQPGSQRDGKSSVTFLATSTRQDNLKTFPDFESLDQVPQFGVTVGVGTIANNSKSAVMVLLGESKRLAFAKITNTEEYDTTWPSSIIVECHNAVLYADKAAATSI